VPRADREALSAALGAALRAPREETSDIRRRAHAAQWTWRRCAMTTLAAYRRALTA
jgi:hypothetical protein